jgi:hypothetical protein
LLPQIAILSKLCKHAGAKLFAWAKPAGMGGGISTNSKPPGWIIMIGESDTASSSRIILITPFSRQSDTGRSSPIILITPFSSTWTASSCTALSRLLTSLSKLCKYSKSKTIFPSQTTRFLGFRVLLSSSHSSALSYIAIALQGPCKPFIACQWKECFFTWLVDSGDSSTLHLE